MSIKLKLGLFIGVFLVLMLGNTLSLQSWIHSAEGRSSGIDIAGKQRMLSQKMAKEAFLLATGQSDQKQQLIKSISMFDQGLKLLAKGDSKLGLSPIENQQALELISKISVFWQGFSSQLQTVSSKSTPEMLTRITNDSLILLEKSNEIVHVLEAQVNDEIADLSTFSFLFLCLGLVSGGAGYFFLQKILLTRIDRIKDASNYIVRERDLSVRIGLTGNDELDHAAQAFDQMLEGFVNMYREVKKVESNLREQVKSLSDSAESNRKNMDDQRGEIIQISTSINQMAATVQEIAQNTLHGSNVSKNSLQAANDGNAILDANIGLTNELAGEVREASNSIEKLVEASHAIGGIANTISGIAEQTNLLALNAAIEAARAGEQGRGFAVVADEVRTLAQKTQDATSQIHSLISTLYETTNSSVATMEKSRVHSEESVNKSKTMRTAFNDIITSVKSLSDISHQIAVSTEEQSTVAEEMERNITRIENKSQITQEIANSNAKSAVNLNQMCELLNIQLNKYKT